MGHLLLACADQVALIVVGDSFEEGGGVDDVGVGGDGERLGDLCCDEDVAIAFLERIVFFLERRGFLLLLRCRGCGGEAAESSETSCSPLRPPKRMPTRSFFAMPLRL